MKTQPFNTKYFQLIEEVDTAIASIDLIIAQEGETDTLKLLRTDAENLLVTIGSAIGESVVKKMSNHPRGC